MTQSVLNLINEAFGTDDYATLADKVGSGAADPHVRSFLDSWRQWAIDWTSPEAPPHAIRPYVLAHWKGDPTSGLSGLWQQDSGGANTSDVLRVGFLRHLLYCDAIALPDPLFGQAAITPILGQAPQFSFLALERMSVAEVIARLAPFAKLIENDVLIVVPYTEEPDLPVPLITDLAEVADTVDAEFPQMPSDWLEITYARRASIDIGAQITMGKGDFDAYLPTQAHVHLFRAMCGTVDSVLGKVSGSPLPENRLFWRLLDCELPDLIDIPLKDVVAMRRNGEFESWRRAVTDGLLRAEALTGHDNDWPGIPASTKHEIALSVQEAAKASEGSLGQSKGKKVTATIDMAAVGGAIAATFLAPPMSTALVGLSALGMLCHAVLRWRLGRPGSFARHVAVFGNTTK
jgi:hypothetical protein